MQRQAVLLSLAFSCSTLRERRDVMVFLTMSGGSLCTLVGILPPATAPQSPESVLKELRRASSLDREVKPCTRCLLAGLFLLVVDFDEDSGPRIARGGI